MEMPKNEIAMGARARIPICAIYIIIFLFFFISFASFLGFFFSLCKCLRMKVKEGQKIA